MKRYEYRRIDLSPSWSLDSERKMAEFTDRLHVLGEEGWRPADLSAGWKHALFVREAAAPAPLLRRYKAEDLGAILGLFYRTVHRVCRGDYTPAQLDAWAPSEIDLSRWADSLAVHYTLVAELEGKLVGFADLDVATGYLDRLYVHDEYQGMGVATALVEALERRAAAAGRRCVTTDASITARPFFAARGYVQEHENAVERAGEVLTNYTMEKYLG